ncbi:MAG: ATPase, T2SS/T4P/T4SS family [Planctomycetota bacterium]
MSGASATANMAGFNNRLKAILTRSGVLGEEQIESAIDRANKDQKHLSTVLVEQKLLEESALIAEISRATNFPPIDLKKVAFERDLLEVLPQDTATEYGVFPVAKIGQMLTLAIGDPFDILKLDDLRIVTGCEIRPVISTPATIQYAIGKGYSLGRQEVEELLEGMIDPEMELKDGADRDDIDVNDFAEKGSPVVRLVNLIIFQAVKEGASDIHIEPYERRVRVRYRVDGILKDTLSPPKNLQAAIVSRLKIMSNLDIAEKHKPQDGKFQVRAEGRQIDFRVSILPVVHGEKAVMRILDATMVSLQLAGLGFQPKCLTDFAHAIANPYGMILVTGPTGSGKSTTLYAAVKEIMSDGINLVTVEDPVEYQIAGINQVPVNPKRGLTFATALRSILRQDPDSILIGEIRDSETIEIAVKAALTGHLVLSTLHTNDAPSTVTRMVDMGLDPFMVASSVVLIAAQRLCRSLCQECREPVELPEERLRQLGFLDEDFVEEFTLYRPKGCSRCNAGYRGRFALLETMPMTEKVKRLVVDGASAIDIKQAALEDGLLTLRRCGILSAIKGRTSMEEVLRVTLAD